MQMRSWRRRDRLSGWAIVVAAILGLFGWDRGMVAGEDQTVRIESEHQAALWPRPAVAVPELPAAPTLDGLRDAAVWDAARPLPLRFATGGNQPEPKPEARAWVGHRSGTLYLLIELDWPGPTPPKSEAKARDGDIWKDDGVEIYLAPAEHLDRPVQLTFNWAGMQGDTAFEYDTRYERVVKSNPGWNPEWEVKIAAGAGCYRAEVALPLKPLIDVAGGRGEVLRFDLVRNRVGGRPGELHWAPIEGQANLRPDYFGFLLLAGAAAQPLPLADLQVTSLNAVVIPERRRGPAVLRGQPARWKLLDPLQGLVTPSPAADLRCELLRADGTVAAAAKVAAAEGVLALAFTADQQSGAFQVRVAGAGPRAVAQSTEVSFHDWLFVAGDNPDAFRVTGRANVRNFPRTVERKILALSRGSRLEFHCEARAIALCLPPSFLLPGPQVGSPLTQQWRWKLDGGDWQALSVAGSSQETILANDLPAGPHTVTLEPVEGDGWLAGFRIAGAPFTRLHGFIHTHEYDELLVDVRAEVWQAGRLVRSEIVRSPHNGSFEILGLAPGQYSLRVTAEGWLPLEHTAEIPAPGAAVDLGMWVLNREERLNGMRGEFRPRFGQSLNVQPGGSWTAVLPSWDGPPKKVILVSRFRQIELPVTATVPLAFGRHNSLAKMTCSVPAGTPWDMYDMRLVFEPPVGRPWSAETGQAVCVRPALPEAFFLAGCGHMNTWGQETAEYLQRVGEVAQLAGAREFLVANEVNPAYISGALGRLRIPYLACAGNHTVGRWDEFFGGQPTATVDGALRLVSFGQYPYESWAEAERLLTTTDSGVEATARGLVCFEGYAPIAVIQRAKVNLLYDGHSDDDHPDEEKFPAGTLHLRAPGQDTLRLVPMTPTGVAVNTEDDCPVLAVPRNQPSPLRVEFSAANDGTQAAMTVNLINEYDRAFDAAQVRLVLAKGVYTLQGATAVQQFDSDDGKITVVDLAIKVAAKSRTEVLVAGKQ